MLYDLSGDLEVTEGYTVSRGTENRAHSTHSNLIKTIAQALHDIDLSSQQEQITALSGIDNFHMGGAETKPTLTEEIAPDAKDHLLDIGAGMGGTARFLISATG